MTCKAEDLATSVRDVDKKIESIRLNRFTLAFDGMLHEVKGWLTIPTIAMNNVMSSQPRGSFQIAGEGP